MIIKTAMFRQLCLFAGVLFAGVVGAQSEEKQDLANAQNSIVALDVSQQAGSVVVKLTTTQPLTAPPASFTVAKPARVAFDFPATDNALGRNSQTVNEGDLRSINVVQVAGRTRLVLNLRQLQQFDTRIDGKSLFITLAAGQALAPEDRNASTQRFAEATSATEGHSIRDINFRRGKDGEGRIVVDMSDSNIGIDIRQQGKNLIVDFVKTALPDNLRRRLDLTDFATPVTTVSTLPQGDNVRMTISPKGMWEHNAYQSDNQFVIEVKPIVEDPNKLVQGSGRGYQGEKLSLNFQNIDVRAVLQVIADFTNFNIITSDSVGGSLTLRLKDVPWDQALDIILQAKGLDMRKNGNVVWIAPRDELAAREKLQLESKQQLTDLEGTRTESFQLNYQKGDAVQRLLTDKTQPILSKRGSAIHDIRTNKLFVQDVPSRLDDVRRLLAEIDVPVQQVLIEARIVEAEDNFARNLGSRLGFHNPSATGNNFANRGLFVAGGGLADTGFHTGQIATPIPDFMNDTLGSNLRAADIAGSKVGQLSFVLFNQARTQFLNLELTALEQDGKGKVISSPRVMTADQIEALIEQGVEIPYQQATSSGATSVSFRKANLALKVKPQITPDGRVMMELDINKDTPNTQLSTGAGVAIDTKHVKTQVLVENGGTVVIGGIYTQDERSTTARIPFLGDIPYVGFLFKKTERRDNKTELLVFITPKIISDKVGMR